MKVRRTARETHLHAARAYLHQARTYRLRGSAFAFTLLDWAANARRRAQGDQAAQVDRAQFGPWWRTPKGIVFHYDQCGYNGVQCFSTPIGFSMQSQKEKRRGIRQYLWHEFVIRFEKVPDFLGRCEYLGKDEPTSDVVAQAHRIGAVESFDVEADDDLKPSQQVQHALPKQGELW